VRERITRSLLVRLREALKCAFGVPRKRTRER